MNSSALNSPIPLSPHPSTILTHSPLLHPLPDTYPDPLTPHPTPHTHLIDRVRTQLSSQFATTGSLIAGSSEKGRLRLNNTVYRYCSSSTYACFSAPIIFLDVEEVYLDWPPSSCSVVSQPIVLN